MRNKIVNDPVLGFITIDDDLLLSLLNHPWLQRLRRIKQLGMTSLVYPGAQHTRLQHAMGAMHLMQVALETLQAKGAIVLPNEQRGAMAAMLLHDVGHGPFSHALERVIVNAHHEDISALIMRRLNEQFGGQLRECLSFFHGECRPFLHQLISSQLDTDRLDYLKRDSFFTGVVEGSVGSDRLIKMLDVTPDEQLAVEDKGIFSIEDFLVARRLMYWQVYLHKTVLAAEQMLRLALMRARHVAKSRELPVSTPALGFFLRNDIGIEELEADDSLLQLFCDIDDDDVATSLKMWRHDKDPILAHVSQGLVDRKLFRIELQREPFSEQRVEDEVRKVAQALGLEFDEARSMVIGGKVSSNTYNIGVDRINVMSVDRTSRQIIVRDISEASDLMRLESLGTSDRRHYLCFPRL